MPEHHCHAIGCEVETNPKMFMCRKHWYKLPKATRDGVWRVYRRGQEIDKEPSEEYIFVTSEARRWLHEKERRDA